MVVKGVTPIQMMPAKTPVRLLPFSGKSLIPSLSSICAAFTPLYKVVGASAGCCLMTLLPFPLASSQWTQPVPTCSWGCTILSLPGQLHSASQWLPPAVLSQATCDLQPS